MEELNINLNDIEIDDGSLIEEGNTFQEEEEEEILDEEYESLDDEDEEEEEEEGRVALAYDPSQLSESNVKGPPLNGHDYLKMVQEERELCDVVTYSKPPLTNQSGSDNFPISPLPSIPDTSEDLKYRNEILENFISLRDKMEKVRESNSSLASSSPSPSNLVKLMELGQPPQLSTIIGKAQCELHQALEEIANQCQIVPYEAAILHCDWIYSIMASLRQPLEPDIYSTLRRLARICKARRASINHKSGDDRNNKQGRDDETEESNSCLLIICIVRNYFGQADLTY